MFRIFPGQAWCIPAGSLHSLNAIGDQKATMIISWNGDAPDTFDLPVIYNALPKNLRIDYTKPGRHAELANYLGPSFNPVNGYNPLSSRENKYLKHKRSPYKIDIKKTVPLFYDEKVGIIQQATVKNWPILKKQNISILTTILKPKVYRDMIWYSDSAILYTVTHGKGNFWLILPGWEPKPFLIQYHDMVLVRANIPHTFQNIDDESNLQMIGIFNNSNPKKESSLAVSTNFFPKAISNSSLEFWGNKRPKKSQEVNKNGPLNHLRNFVKNPYLFPGKKIRKKNMEEI